MCVCLCAYDREREREKGYSQVTKFNWSVETLYTVIFPNTEHFFKKKINRNYSKSKKDYFEIGNYWEKF